MSDQPEGGYSLLLSFEGLYPSMEEEHAFVHGVEFNEIWRRMRDGKEAEIETATHVENRKIICRAAASQGWDAEIAPSGIEGWDTTKLRKVRPERHNPHGLRLIGDAETTVGKE
jgi:hypothetical protein